MTSDTGFYEHIPYTQTQIDVYEAHYYIILWFGHGTELKTIYNKQYNRVFMSGFMVRQRDYFGFWFGIQIFRQWPFWHCNADEWRVLVAHVYVYDPIYIWLCIHLAFWHAHTPPSIVIYRIYNIYEYTLSAIIKSVLLTVENCVTVHPILFIAPKVRVRKRERETIGDILCLFYMYICIHCTYI